MLFIDHIGYAIKKMEQGKRAFEVLGYKFGDVIEDADRKVDICFGEKDGHRIELICPKCVGSPVDDIIRKLGNTPYHICYSSDALDNDLAELKMGGYKVTIPAQKAIAFGGRRVIFLYSLAVGLIELVEK